jgi:HEPN domain-containing protein
MRRAHEPWITKAEEDLLVCKILIESDDFPTMAVCFHAQQVCEKYLKAFLTANQVEFPKIHDLIILLEDYCVPINNSFIILKPKLIGLTEYAANTRYPGGNFPPTLTEAKEAYEAALQTKDFILIHL